MTHRFHKLNTSTKGCVLPTNLFTVICKSSDHHGSSLQEAAAKMEAELLQQLEEGGVLKSQTRLGEGILTLPSRH